MKKSIFTIVAITAMIFVANAQTADNLLSPTDVPFGFDLRDADHPSKYLIESSWSGANSPNQLWDYATFSNTGGGGIAGDMSLRLSRGRGFEFGNGNFSSTFMTLTKAGKLGIGLTNPTEALDITTVGGNAFIKVNRTATQSSPYGSSGIKLGPNAQIYTSFFPASGSGTLYLTNNAPIKFSGSSYGFGTTPVTGSTKGGTFNVGTYAWINSLMVGDYVGVTGDNTLPTGYKLGVRGKVICEELTVNLVQNWPDYVFNKNYKLKSLNEVETYINENNHLPGVPSANEVESNGLSIGEMQKVQMEKIEELTLYMIDMKKELETLKSENKQLKAQLTK